MHVRKACNQLRELLRSSSANLDTLTKAAVLLDGLERENTDPAWGRPNGTVTTKLQSARLWCETLCGFGEDCNRSQEEILQLVWNDLLVVEGEMQADGLRFKFRPALGT